MFIPVFLHDIIGPVIRGPFELRLREGFPWLQRIECREHGFERDTVTFRDLFQCFFRADRTVRAAAEMEHGKNHAYLRIFFKGVLDRHFFVKNGWGSVWSG